MTTSHFGGLLCVCVFMICTFYYSPAKMHSGLIIWFIKKKIYGFYGERELNYVLNCTVCEQGVRIGILMEAFTLQRC